MELVLKTELSNLMYRGKVRDSYDLGDSMLLVATDRISAFDVVLPCGIPLQGSRAQPDVRLLVREDRAHHQEPRHQGHRRCRVAHENYGKHACYGSYGFPSYLEGRSMLVKKAERLPIECVVRGYLSGSAWAEYKKKAPSRACTSHRAGGEREAAIPIFTPTTKADSGHDLPMSFNQVKKAIGAGQGQGTHRKCVKIYEYANNYALAKASSIADTKMEFGIVDDEMILIDELLTPIRAAFGKQRE